MNTLNRQIDIACKLVGLAAGTVGGAAATAADDEDECVIVEPRPRKKKQIAGTTVSAGVLSDANGKRKRSANEIDGSGHEKRAKLSEPIADVIDLE